MADHRMRLRRRAERRAAEERAALGLAAGARAAHHDESISVERAAEHMLEAGIHEDGAASVQAAEKDGVELAWLAGALVRHGAGCERKEQHRRDWRSPSPPLRSDPHETQPARQAGCSLA
jgi:hypothetical protein